VGDIRWVWVGEGDSGDIFESARIHGADHITIFRRVMIPLSVPVLTAFRVTVVPFVVFFALPRFLIRGITAGSARG